MYAKWALIFANEVRNLRDFGCRFHRHFNFAQKSIPKNSRSKCRHGIPKAFAKLRREFSRTGREFSGIKFLSFWLRLRVNFTLYSHPLACVISANSRPPFAQIRVPHSRQFASQIRVTKIRTQYRPCNRCHHIRLQPTGREICEQPVQCLLPCQ